MKEDFGMSPSVGHYVCVTDLLVRAGQLDEAVEFIKNMPFKADAISWTSIIGGCKAQGNEALLHKVANKLKVTLSSPISICVLTDSGFAETCSAAVIEHLTRRCPWDWLRLDKTS